MRRYWQPVALVEEVGADPLPVRILGEDLVLFRDDRGQLGLLGMHCSHRGVDLSYGRVEDGGLRCLYHGWLYDVRGRCLQQPGEPAGSDFCSKIQHLAYPVQQRAGMVFAYLGPGEPPLLPNYDFLAADPDEEMLTLKILQDCNYLQALEGNLDQVHLSFLHRLEESAIKGTVIGQAAPEGTQRSNASLLAFDGAPRIETEVTSFGMREAVIRKAPEGSYLKVSNCGLPCFAAAVGSTIAQGGYLVNWHVPIDDRRHWKYVITFRRGALDKDGVRFAFLGDSKILPDGSLTRNAANRYRQDRAELRGRTYAGLGTGFAVHDTWAVETAGTVFDRTVEHLGYEDKSVIAVRQMLLDAIQCLQRGEDPPHIIRRPEDNKVTDLVVIARVLPEDKPWSEAVQEYIAAKQGEAERELVGAETR